MATNAYVKITPSVQEYNVVVTEEYTSELKFLSIHSLSCSLLTFFICILFVHLHTLPHVILCCVQMWVFYHATSTHTVLAILGFNPSSEGSGI